MQIVATILKLLVVLGGGYLLTTRVIPWLFVRAIRLVGFSGKLSPVTQKRVARFKRIKRGYFAFLTISTLFVTSLFLELIVNNKPLAIYYDGEIAFPAVKEWVGKVLFFAKISSFYKQEDFGQIGKAEVDYREFARQSSKPEEFRAELVKMREELQADQAKFEKENPPPPANAKESTRRKYERAREKLKKREDDLSKREKIATVFEEGRAWCIMPVYPHSPDELRLEFETEPPNEPSIAEGIPAGTDMAGRDVFVLMLYGFRVSLSFALLIMSIGYCIGIVIGGMQGYFGGWTDIITQRVEEIWASIPFLYTIMIIASIVTPSFALLVLLMVVMVSWLGITFYVRAEFYREKAKDYVQAAIGAGVSNWKIITRHILPNALVPVVTFAPFAIVGYIGSLVALDFLGFGLPKDTPSWGAVMRQGLENVKFNPHLIIVPIIALAATLYCIVLIGEAVREAFDPKVYSRLR